MNQVQAALMDAIKSTDVEAFERLHDGYSDLEFRDGFGYTPLMVAAYLDMAFFCTRLLALSPPRQNSCRPDRIDEQGAMMEERIGSIRTGIQG